MPVCGPHHHQPGSTANTCEASRAGDRTCEDGPGSKGHEEEDALDYAAWGVDYVKYDFCGMEDAAEKPRHCALLPGCLLTPTLQPSGCAHG